MLILAGDVQIFIAANEHEKEKSQRSFSTNVGFLQIIPESKTSLQPSFIYLENNEDVHCKPVASSMHTNAACAKPCNTNNNENSYLLKKNISYHDGIKGKSFHRTSSVRIVPPFSRTK